MSSFPQHEDNIIALNKLGFDVSDCIEDGKVTLESWGYDELVYLISSIIKDLHESGYKRKNYEHEA